MNLGVQGFDAALEDFGEASHVGNVRHTNACGLKRLERAARADQFKAAFNQSSGEGFKFSFVGNGQNSASHVASVASITVLLDSENTVWDGIFGPGERPYRGSRASPRFGRVFRQSLEPPGFYRQREQVTQSPEWKPVSITGKGLQRHAYSGNCVLLTHILKNLYGLNDSDLTKGKDSM